MRSSAQPAAARRRAAPRPKKADAEKKKDDKKPRKAAGPDDEDLDIYEHVRWREAPHRARVGNDGDARGSCAGNEATGAVRPAAAGREGPRRRGEPASCLARRALKRRPAIHRERCATARRVLTWNDPNVARNITKYSYRELTYKLDPPGNNDHLAVHFAMDGCMLHRETDEAKMQEVRASPRSFAAPGVAR